MAGIDCPPRLLFWLTPLIVVESDDTWAASLVTNRNRSLGGVSVSEHASQEEDEKRILHRLGQEDCSF